MSKSKTATKSTDKPKSDFKPTFISYKNDMNEREQAIFRQGATTANNNIKERLGLKKPRDKK